MKKEIKAEESVVSITLNEGRRLWIYENEDVDFLKSSNEPHFNVEDYKSWQSHKVDNNTNLIGQIHKRNEGVVFHLCHNPNDKILTKNDLKAIIKGIEYIEEFVEKHAKAHKK